MKVLKLIPPVDDNLAIIFLLQSNWDEINSFLSWQIIFVILITLLIAYMLFLPITNKNNIIWKIKLKTRSIVSLISIIILFILFPLIKNYVPYNFLSLNVDFSSNIDYSHHLKIVNKKVENPLIVFFIGESLRADHLSLNGYKKRTTPLIDNTVGIVNFGFARSCATYTKASWLYLTKKSTCDQPIKNQTSIQDIFKTFNYQTLFLGMTDIATEKYLYQKADISKSFGRDDYRIDHYLDTKLLSKNSFIILGHRGSHYPYNTYPQDATYNFTPTCKINNFVQMQKDCSLEDIINKYDNTILQLDKSINGIIKILSTLKRPVLFFYTSDHGEMLGENNIWAHGFSPQLKETHLVPLIIWANNSYKKQWKSKYDALINNQKKYKNQVQHDNLWYSILDGAGIINKDKNIIQSDKSIFSSNFKPEINKDWYLPDYPRN